jgi:hypothetical protein
MSPAGISMLYTAMDEVTAVAETVDKSDVPVHYTVAQLRVEADVRILDLVKLPRSPGIFTPETTRESRAAIHFAHAFAGDLSKLIARDGMEHIEYVPTQVVTEYLRYRFRSAGHAIHGIRYRSSRVPEGNAVVLFASYDDLHKPSARSSQVLPVTLIGSRRHVFNS